MCFYYKYYFFWGGGGGRGGKPLFCFSFCLLFCSVLDIFPSKQIPLLQLEGWGMNPALREAFLRQVFSHIRGKRTVRHAQV